MSSKLRFAIGGLVVVAAIAVLIVFGFRSGSDQLKVAEVKALEPNQTRSSQVAGEVISATKAYDVLTQHLTFDIQDSTGTLTISYHGPEPSGMADAVEAVVIGKYDPGAQVFEAEDLRMKCPSKYEEAQK